MLGGLYGDLPEAKSEAGKGSADGGRWAVKPAFAPPIRKPVVQQHLRPNAPGIKKAVKAQDGRLTREEGNGVTNSTGASMSGLLGSATHGEQFQDEYDPAKPNDYEAVRSQREKEKYVAQEEADRQEELRLLQEQDRKADERMGQAAQGGEREAVLAMSGEEAFLRRGRLRKPGNEASQQDTDASSNFAQRMMQKMGWKEGLGLGKTHQGITTHLEHQKTDRSVGVIRHAAPLHPDDLNQGPPEKKTRGVVVQGDPSRVVLLRNIVGPGQVDDNLEDEIGEECSKYGPISQITIFEATDPNFPADEAVRIFVQFERMESAMKAAIDLEGRFFGGRTVKAMFFSEAKFDRQELAPVAGQPD